jgi:hypothetical protein
MAPKPNEGLITAHDFAVEAVIRHTCVKAIAFSRKDQSRAEQFCPAPPIYAPALGRAETTSYHRLSVAASSGIGMLIAFIAKSTVTRAVMSAKQSKFRK